MDKQALAVLIPVLVVLFVGLNTRARSAIGKAIARRIQGKSGELEQGLLQEVHALREQVLTLEQQIGQLDERLDFSERPCGTGPRCQPAALARGGLGRWKTF